MKKIVPNAIRQAALLLICGSLFLTGCGPTNIEDETVASNLEAISNKEDMKMDDNQEEADQMPAQQEDGQKQAQMPAAPLAYQGRPAVHGGPLNCAKPGAVAIPCTVVLPTKVEVLPTVHTNSAELVPSSKVRKILQPIDRIHPSHHHHVRNHVLNDHTQFQTLIRNRPVSSSSQSATFAVNRTQEVLPTIVENVAAVSSPTVVTGMPAVVRPLPLCPYHPAVCARLAAYRGFGYYR